MADPTATAAGAPRSPAEAVALGKRLADEGRAVGWPTTAAPMTPDELRWHLVAYHFRSIGWAATATEAKMQGVHGPLHDPNVDTFNGRPDHDHA